MLSCNDKSTISMKNKWAIQQIAKKSAFTDNLSG